MFLLVKNYKNMSLCITSCAKVQTEMLSIHLLLKLIFLSLHFLSLLTVATQGICVLQHKTKNYTEPPLWVWLWQGNGSDGWDVAHKTQMRPFTESISAYKWIASIMTTYLFTTWFLFRFSPLLLREALKMIYFLQMTISWL